MEFKHIPQDRIGLERVDWDNIQSDLTEEEIKTHSGSWRAPDGLTILGVNETLFLMSTKEKIEKVLGKPTEENDTDMKDLLIFAIVAKESIYDTPNGVIEVGYNFEGFAISIASKIVGTQMFGHTVGENKIIQPQELDETLFPDNVVISWGGVKTIGGRVLLAISFVRDITIDQKTGNLIKNRLIYMNQRGRFTASISDGGGVGHITEVSISIK